MNMICIAAHLYRVAFQSVTDATKVSVEFMFNIFTDHGFPIFGTEYDVDIVLYERLTHCCDVESPGLHPGVKQISPFQG